MSNLAGIGALSRALGASITPEVAKPFLDLEKERNRLMRARTWLGPLGGLAMHLPMLPAKYLAPAAHAMGQSGVSPSGAILEAIGQNSITGIPGADYASTAAGHIGPMLIMGLVGSMGGLGAGTLASKLWGWLSKRRAAKKERARLSSPAENPILGV